MPAFQSQIHLPDLLEHDLNQYFPYLLQFESLENAKQSEVYKKIKPTVDQILSAVVCENFATSPHTSAVAEDLGLKPFAVEESNELEIRPTNYAGGSDISVVAWNIERGRIFDGILETLKNHDNLKEKDLYLLTELDYGMIRSGNVTQTAKEEAKKQGLT